MNVAEHYARALLALSLDKKVDGSLAMQNFSKVLARRGHTKLLPRIFSEFEKVQRAQQAQREVVVRVANDAARAHGLTKARTLSERYGLSVKDIRVKEDDTLVQGYVVEGPGFRYDASARAALKSLYEKLIA